MAYVSPIASAKTVSMYLLPDISPVILKLGSYAGGVNPVTCLITTDVPRQNKITKKQALREKKKTPNSRRALILIQKIKVTSLCDRNPSHRIWVHVNDLGNNQRTGHVYNLTTFLIH